SRMALGFPLADKDIAAEVTARQLGGAK
ncbi:MAG: hypothetical protein ACI80W_001808, partial [Porticoccaceae bacterium]